MSNDIDGTVVGIQGNPVNPLAPNNEDVITWDAGDGYYKLESKQGITKIYFSSNGTWTCPQNVSSVLCIAAGGAGYLYFVY